MDNEFITIIEHLEKKYTILKNMTAVKLLDVPKDCPVGGVYLISENGGDLYAGRTKRSIKTRLKDHIGTAPDCPLAWRLTRKNLNLPTADYQKANTRKSLLTKPDIKKEYNSAKKRVQTMEVRYVDETDPIKQALLEIYVAFKTKAPFNDFATH
jgi:hypothetical protein